MRVIHARLQLEKKIPHLFCAKRVCYLNSELGRVGNKAFAYGLGKILIAVLNISYLTNRFHVAVRLFSNRSQMTSNCSKNEIVAHKLLSECVTDVNNKETKLNNKETKSCQ